MWPSGNANEDEGGERATAAAAPIATSALDAIVFTFGFEGFGDRGAGGAEIGSGVSREGDDPVVSKLANVCCGSNTEFKDEGGPMSFPGLGFAGAPL